jgi:inactivated superfamily I helicase
MKQRHPKAETLTTHLVRFFNVAFGRKIRGSREFIDSVSAALQSGYSEDEIRLAFWVARCTSGKAAWLGENLRDDLLPHILLRHHGRLNNVTGKEAKRWLDDLLARAGETSSVMVKALYESLPEELQEAERGLLERMEMPWR